MSEDGLSELLSEEQELAEELAKREAQAQAMAALSPAELQALLERKLRDAVRRGASMQDIAALRPNAISSPDEAIAALEEGNGRFFSGESSRPELSAFQRRSQILGQAPFAVILACSDSRVPVELVFDQGLGDLFVVRVAGNVIGEEGLGTIEYAICHLKVQLVMVLGHEGCGAVEAAMSTHEELQKEPEKLRQLIERIRPSVANLPDIRDRKARMREAVICNVRHQVHLLRQEEMIAEAEKAGTIRVIGGFYEIGSGAVDFYTEEEDLRLTLPERTRRF